MTDLPAYELHPQQMGAMELLIQEVVDQLLFGGAAGGGKSYLARALAYHLAMSWPGARIPFFRRFYPELQKTVVAPWLKEMRALGYDVDSPKVWRATDKEFHFPNGSVVEFLHIDQQIGAEKWLSAEWAALIVEEATQIAEKDLKILYSRVRANADQKREWKLLTGRDWHPTALYVTNPGGSSHAYFKREFYDPAMEHGLDPWDHQMEVDTGLGVVETFETRRAFLPSKVADNPSIDRVEYSASLAALGETRRNQLLGGDWETFEGKVFDKLDPSIHLIDRRSVFGGEDIPPAAWPRIIGLDHGTTSPTAAEWVTRDEDGFFIAYLEYYSPGPVGNHITAIKDKMIMDGHPEIHPESDPRMWHKTKGHSVMYSVADEYAFNGEPPQTRDDYNPSNGIRLRKATITREAGRMAMQRLLAPNDDLQFPSWHPLRGEYGAPKLFIAHQCPNLWRELNGIQFEGSAESGIFSEETLKEDDHAYDAAYRAVPVLEVRLMSARRGRMRTLEAV